MQLLIDKWAALDTRRKYIFSLYKEEKISHEVFNLEMEDITLEYRIISREIDKYMSDIMRGPN